MRLLDSVLVAAFLIVPGGVAAQEPIRVGVDLVNVGFTVRDAHGALVGNLTRDDFEVFEDAVPQKIEPSPALRGNAWRMIAEVS